MTYLVLGWIVVFVLLMFPRDEFTRVCPVVTLPTTTSGPPLRGWTSGFV